MKKFYVTTPIYYVNDVPHIGHSYSTVAADVLARYYRLLYGKQDVLFLTGTDEHGQKVSRAAESRGVSPQEHCDQMAEPFKKLWKKLEISYDDFIRTTEDRHQKVVQHIFQALYVDGYIYKDTYKGWYCIYEETFYTESQLKDGKCCPECGRETEWVEEESYFFKLSDEKLGQKLKELILKDEFQILPQSRKNEVLSFIESGLKDISVSRTTFSWGVPVPFDSKHVVYVWFDALINYITGSGYLQNNEKFNKFWPADVHIVGKDILKFHCVIWPMMLLALGIDPPKMVFAHGFLTLGGEKISKSKGIIVDPLALADKYGADAFRYFFLSEFAFGLDGEYTEVSFIKRVNSDLSNDLGNLVHRTANMMNKYFDGKVPDGKAEVNFDLKRTKERIHSSIAVLDYKEALAALWDLIKFLNKYIEDSAPWILKKQNKEEQLANVMYGLSDGLREISQFLYPFLPETAQKIWEQVGMKGNIEDLPFEKVSEQGVLPPGSHFKVTKPLFPRIEV